MAANELLTDRARAQAVVHRLDRGRQGADGRRRRARSRGCRSSSAATRRSWCSTTPTSSARSRALIAASSATPARPASAPTGSTCSAASTTRSRRLAREGRRAQGRPRPGERGRHHRSADRRRRGGQGRGARRGRASRRAPAARRRRARSTRAPGVAARFYAPTMLDDVSDDMLVSREETFGPVAGARAVRQRGRRDRRGQRHASTAWPRTSTRATPRACCAWPSGSSTASSAPTTARLDRPGAVRRRQAVGLRPRGRRHVMDEYLESSTSSSPASASSRVGAR